MNPMVYALFAYGLTAVISFAVIGIIVFINYVMNGKNTREGE